MVLLSISVVEEVIEGERSLYREQDFAAVVSHFLESNTLRGECLTMCDMEPSSQGHAGRHQIGTQ